MEHAEFSKPVWFIGAPERILGKGPGLPIETAYFRISFTVKGKAEVKKLLKIDYPPPKVVALRRFYGYATAIFEDKITTGIAHCTLPPAKQVGF